MNQERKQPGKPPQSIQALSNDRFKKYAEGGFTSPISRTGLNTGNTATNSIKSLSDQQVAHFARQVALHVKAGTKEGIGEGLNDAKQVSRKETKVIRKITSIKIWNIKNYLSDKNKKNDSKKGLNIV